MGGLGAAPLPARQRVIDPRWYGFIELGLVFGLVLGWAGWQWWGWWRWRREQARRQGARSELVGDDPPRQS
jgi:hypothetical protein